MKKIKYKIGDKVSFPFAGTMHVGVLEEIQEVKYGTVHRIYYKCRTKDGTLYPLDLTQIEKI